MTVEPSLAFAIAVFLLGQAVAIVGAWWNMRAKVESHEAKLSTIERDHKTEISALVTAQTALTQTVSGIQLEIARGFSRIEEQIKTLFRDQDKHP